MPAPGGTWAIIVAAGEGRRFGRPKQFDLLDGRTVLQWSIDAARAVADGVIAVVPVAHLDDPSAGSGADRVVAGGSSRSESVRAGLAVVPSTAVVIVVHDAARPLASPALFRAVVEAIAGDAAGAVPGVPLADTVKRVESGSVVETLDRSRLVAVQTPQAFLATALRDAHATGLDATDDAALVEALGLRVAVVPGEASNRKITEASDLESMVQGIEGSARERHRDLPGPR